MKGRVKIIGGGGGTFFWDLCVGISEEVKNDNFRIFGRNTKMREKRSLVSSFKTYSGKIKLFYNLKGKERAPRSYQIGVVWKYQEGKMVPFQDKHRVSSEL
jgi:hypothetical protein